MGSSFGVPAVLVPNCCSPARPGRAGREPGRCRLRGSSLRKLSAPLPRLQLSATCPRQTRMRMSSLRPRGAVRSYGVLPAQVPAPGFGRKGADLGVSRYDYYFPESFGLSGPCRGNQVAFSRFAIRPTQLPSRSDGGVY